MLDAAAISIVREMNIPTSLSRVLAVITLLIAAATTAGCGDGGEGTPDYCASISTLEDSVQELTELRIEVGTLGELETRLKEIKSDVQGVREEAGDEFSAELDAMDKAVSEFGANVQAAATKPSLETVAKIGTSIETLANATQNLRKAVQDAC